MLPLVTARLVGVLVGLDVIQHILEVPEHVLNISSRAPVLGGTAVLIFFEPPPVLGRTGLDRAKLIVNRLAMRSVFSLTD